LKWFINNAEQTALENQLNPQITLPSGNHSIRMEVKDIYNQTQTISTDFTVMSTVITAPSTIYVGETAQLTLSPATNGTWASADNAIATVDNNGVITGISEGETTFVFTPATLGACPVTSSVVKVRPKSVQAVVDIISLIYNDSVTFDALANDIFTCDKSLLNVDAFNGSNGTLTVNPDKTFTYTPTKNFFGIDSVDYTIQCEGNSHSAKVYFVVSKPLALYYMVCPQMKYTIGMHAILGVEYHWYEDATVEDAVVENFNELEITKDDSDVQSWYVEAVYKGVKLSPRYRMSVFKAENCGNENPSDCAVDGQLLFREDFGGNNSADSRVSTQKLPDEITDYTFNTTDRLTKNQYALVKYIDPQSNYAWQKNFGDHTNPEDKNRGYMFLVDAAENPGKFYETRITGLCDNIDQLYFSAWVANVIPTSNTTATHDPELKFDLLDDNNNLIATYITSSVPRDADGAVKWRNYGFTFDPKGYSSLTLKIYNNETGSNGNDFVLDDIEIYLCVPPITIENKLVDTVCVGSSVKFKALYSDINSTFSGQDKKIAYRWEYSIDANNWLKLGEDTVTSSTTVQSTYVIDKVTELDKGYYRFIISNIGSMDNPLCRIISKTISLNVFKKYVAPDLRIMIAPATSQHTVYLSSFTDTSNVLSIKWDGLGSGLNFIDDETGALDAQKFMHRRVYTYKYTTVSTCGTSTANAYVFTSTDKMRIKNGREIFVCKDLELSKYINLNQILGLENNGTWSYPNDTNGVVAGNVGTSSAKFGGSKIFNAQKAYDDASQTTVYDVAGKPDMKAFKFKYTAVDGTAYDFTIVAGKQ
jgi:hypothetical protein